LTGLESSSKSEDVRPSPSDDFRRRKMPFIKSVRVPRTKTIGSVVIWLPVERRSKSRSQRQQGSNTARHDGDDIPDRWRSSPRRIRGVSRPAVYLKRLG
jgi:hypothetical protein